MSEPQLIALSTRRRGKQLPYRTRANVMMRFRCTEEQKADVEGVAREEGRSLSDVVRDAIDSYVGDMREGVVFASRSKSKP